MDSIDEAVGIGVDVSAVHGNFVVEILLRPSPVPLRDDDVALNSLRTRRSGRQFPGLNAIGPVAKVVQDAFAAEIGRPGAHHAANLCRLDTPVPSRSGGIEGPERRFDL